MHVYHFLSERWAIDDLENRRLKISLFHELNDPFELMCYELPTAAYRVAFRDKKERLAREFGLLCFSRSWKSPVLWSHYADKHKGICLGFAADDVVQVTYTTTRPHFAGSPADITDTFAHEWLCTKFEGWKYEDEVRAIARLDEAEKQSGRYYRRFGPRLQLKQVIVGPLCHVTARLQKAIATQAGEVEFVKARLAFRSFGVTKNKQNVWNPHQIRVPRLI